MTDTQTPPNTIQQRSVAIHTSIAELQNGTFEQRPGWEPNVVKVGEKQISRVNIIGAVVAMAEGTKNVGVIEQLQLTVDDGSGTITVRSFEPIYSHKEIALGSPILIIGKPREYQNELFITAEIVRVVDKKWLDARKKELPEPTTQIETSEKPPESQSLSDIIDALDSGDGVSVEELKAKMGDSVEERINRLLMVGEAYEVRPGRIKILK